MKMSTTENVINDLNTAKFILGNTQIMLTRELRIRIGQAINSAIDLLEEQEPILLENQHKPYGISTNANSPWISRCPKCGKKVEGRQTKYCKYCGQAVKWECAN
jgi:hypothetical protein